MKTQPSVKKSPPKKAPAERVVKDIRRATRRHFSAEEKIRIVESLHHAGIFYMKGAVSEVAAQLGSSEATIYRYLNRMNGAPEGSEG